VKSVGGDELTSRDSFLGPLEQRGEITIFVAAEIVTMDPRRPKATHVAVCEGRILGVGPLDELEVWGPYTLDETFADYVIVPGMIEAHAHVIEGALWELPYVGFHPRRGPAGQIEGGQCTIDELLARLHFEDAQLADPTQPLICWGLDPLYFPGERLTAAHLDMVSRHRQIIVLHASLHLATVNTATLHVNGIDADTETEGVLRDENGDPLGELQEFPAMLTVKALAALFRDFSDPRHLWTLARQAINGGITTVTNLAGSEIASPAAAAPIAEQVGDPTFPVRLVIYCLPGNESAEVVAERITTLQRSNTDKLIYGGVKIVGDGSIQGYTAVMNWPGYINGAPQGLWQIDPDRMKDLVGVLHAAGINMHLHANGDATIDAVIDAVDHALRNHAWLNHRHTLQHSQITTPAHYRKMARLGMCANLFTNHLWYWGDQHYTSTLGPDRTHNMETCATAAREGIRFSIHSDAPVTPLNQLHTMWCATNRTTPTGRTLGPNETITAYQALAAVTIDAAYQLHLDHTIGSIETGKHADFTVLTTNPLTCDPHHIRDIGIWGTVLAGTPQPAN
jgi:predicted amidohydrolase YtcJ